MRKRGKKLLLFTPHLPPKLLNFIPRTNKSIFIAAGRAGSGLTVLPFLFFKVLLNLLGSAGMLPLVQYTPPSFWLLLLWPSRQGSIPPDLLWCSQEAFQSPASLPGGRKRSANLLFVWHFIVFLTLPARTPPAEPLMGRHCLLHFAKRENKPVALNTPGGFEKPRYPPPQALTFSPSLACLPYVGGSEDRMALIGISGTLLNATVSHLPFLTPKSHVSPRLDLCIHGRGTITAAPWSHHRGEERM